MSELIDKINLDLCNFADILRAYVLTDQTALTAPKDMDIMIKPTIESSIEKFASELKNSRDLLTRLQALQSHETYKNIEKLYNRHKKIERKYIYQLFKCKYDYDISASVFYKHLTQIDAMSFKMVLAPGGAKCFIL
ncbi:TPA: hypothetical protein R1703_001534 [Campylobacter lari]|nr:hypothetical protein [Campylobacter lari]